MRKKIGTLAESVRDTARNEIETYGSTASLYAHDDATITTNEEGDESITWSSATTIKVVSSDHMSFKKMMENMGIESDESGRSFLIKDNVTVEEKDKIVIGTDAYEVTNIKLIDPIQDTTIMKKIEVNKNERYIV